MYPEMDTSPGYFPSAVAMYYVCIHVLRFWRKLKRRTVAKTHLSGVHYGLLGELENMLWSLCCTSCIIQRLWKGISGCEL